MALRRTGLLTANRKAIAEDPTRGDPRIPDLLHHLRGGDVDAARLIVASATNTSDREHLVLAVLDAKVDLLALDGWITAHPDDAWAHLVRGVQLVGWAWEARGHGRSQTVGESAFEEFWARLRRAEWHLLHAAELDPTDPLPWGSLLTSGRGLQVAFEELCLRFEECNRRFPGLPGAHAAFLQGACRKWRGSHDQMFGFATMTASAASPGSPLHALVVAAHFEQQIDLDDTQAFRHYFASPGVRAQVHFAATQSVLHPSWIDVPAHVPAMNVIAGGLLMIEERSLAQQVAGRIGVRRSGFPWDYIGDDAGQAFARALAG